MKKYLILLLIFFICYNSYGNIKKDDIKAVTINQDLELNNMLLSDILAVLSRELDKSIIADENCKDIRLDLFFSKGEKLDNILESICIVNNLKMKKIEDIIIFSKLNIPSSGESTLAGRVLVKGYEKGLKDVKVTVKGSMVNPVLTAYGGNFVINDLNPGIYVVKFEKEGFFTEGQLVNIDKNINMVTAVLEKKNNSSEKNISKEIYEDNSFFYDDENYTKKFQLHNITAEETADIISNIYGDSLKAVTVPRLSLLILTGEKKKIVEAEKFIQELDRDKRQVRITSQILDVTDNLFEELGFDWLYGQNKTSTENSFSGDFLNSGSTEGAGTVFRSTLGFVKQFNGGSDILKVGINLLQSTQDLVISAVPSIVVTDREEGEFKITEEVIVGEEKKENDNTEKTTYTPLFKEAGIILKVKPIIREDDIIVLKIKIEVSNFKLKKSDNLSDGTGTYNSDGGSKVGRSIETTVQMKDGETIFIGGLKRAIVHELNSQVPILGDIPALKIFFRNKSVKKEITDIYVRLKVDIEKDDRGTDEFDKTEIHQQAENIINRKIYPVF